MEKKAGRVEKNKPDTPPISGELYVELMKRSLKNNKEERSAWQSKKKTL